MLHPGLHLQKRRSEKSDLVGLAAISSFHIHNPQYQRLMSTAVLPGNRIQTRLATICATGMSFRFGIIMQYFALLLNPFLMHREKGRMRKNLMNLLWIHKCFSRYAGSGPNCETCNSPTIFLWILFLPGCSQAECNHDRRWNDMQDRGLFPVSLAPIAVGTESRRYINHTFQTRKDRSDLKSQNFIHLKHLTSPDSSH